MVEQGDESYKQIKIIFNFDEEHGSIYSRKLIEHEAADVRYVLIVEPSDMEGSLVTGMQGGGKFELHKIIKLHGLNDLTLGIYVNVGVIGGGPTSNTIAPMLTGILIYGLRHVSMQWNWSKNFLQVKLL